MERPCPHHSERKTDAVTPGFSTAGRSSVLRPARRLLLLVAIAVLPTTEHATEAAAGSAFLHARPASGASKVAPDVAIEVTLAENPGWAGKLLPSQLSDLQIEGTLSGIHPVEATYNPVARILTVNSASPYLPGEMVRVAVLRGESFPGAALSFQVAAGAALGHFETRERLVVGSGPNMISAADLDGDRDVDLIVSEVLDKDGIHVFLNDGFGRFTGLPVLTIPGLEDPTRFAVGDVDRDRHLDLITIGEGSTNLALCRGRGDGTFEPVLARPLESRTPVQAVIGDLNLDGHAEVIVAHLSSSDRITILSGDASGILGRERRVRVGRGIQSLAIQDLDGDGDLDLAMANEESDQIVVLRNGGDGRFELAVTMTVGGRPEVLVAGDLNGDGTVDLMSVNQGTSDVSVLLGRGNLNYAPPVAWSVGERPVIPALADLDGDGDLDLAVPGLFSDDVTVLVNDGSGDFHVGSKITVDSGPVGIAAADFDGDGALDLAVANSVGDNVQILKNATIPAAPAPEGSPLPGLAQNVPNPFNPATEIAYHLANPGYVTLVVFNTSGKVVRTLVDRYQGSGHQVAVWDGSNEEGEKLPSGIYFYRLSTDETVELRRMTLIR